MTYETFEVRKELLKRKMKAYQLESYFRSVSTPKRKSANSKKTTF